MRPYLKASPLLGILILISCGVLQNQTKYTSIASILNNCNSLKGKKVELIATYKGWHCPKNCPNPGITRSDTCWVDNTGCIYSKGFGGLNPLKDVNRTYKLQAIIKSNNRTCYLEIKEVEKYKR
jgi:hypothetical protein